MRWIPRQNMPQVDEKDLPRLVADSFSLHGCTFEVVAPTELHAHQRVSHARALSMPQQVMAKPIVISRDNYVLDGNHRWFAHKEHKLPLLAIRIDLPFDEALDWLLDLPYSYKLTHTTPIRN